VLPDPAEEKRGSRPSSDSADSDFSFFSDTGDLAEQLTELAEEEDPLRIDLRGSPEAPGEGRDPSPQARGRKRKRVRYIEQDHLEKKIINPGVDKEAIVVPVPAPRKITRSEQILAVILSGGNRESSKMHGLTGKPLLWVVGESRLHGKCSFCLLGTLPASSCRWASSSLVMIRESCRE
jgi:hypothetical protein